MKIQLLSNFDKTWELPTPSTPGAAAYDLRWAGKNMSLFPGQHAQGGTGIALDIGSGAWLYDTSQFSLAGFVLPRSGLGTKYGICLRNDIGLIDSDYRGELMVCLENRGNTVFALTYGMRVAQLVFQLVFKPRFEKVKSLEPTERGKGGHGSTGTL